MPFSPKILQFLSLGRPWRLENPIETAPLGNLPAPMATPPQAGGLGEIPSETIRDPLLERPVDRRSFLRGLGTAATAAGQVSTGLNISKALRPLIGTTAPTQTAITSLTEIWNKGYADASGAEALLEKDSRQGGGGGQEFIGMGDLESKYLLERLGSKVLAQGTRQLQELFEKHGHGWKETRKVEDWGIPNAIRYSDPTDPIGLPANSPALKILDEMNSSFFHDDVNAWYQEPDKAKAMLTVLQRRDIPISKTEFNDMLEMVEEGAEMHEHGTEEEWNEVLAMVEKLRGL